MLFTSKSPARRRHRASIVALVLSSLLLTPSNAAAPNSGPGPNPQTDRPVSGGGEVTSPGDVFTPWRPDAGPENRSEIPTPKTKKPKLPPLNVPDLGCDLALNERTGTVRLSNATDAMIPAGTQVEVNMVPGYIKRTVTLTADLPPGAGITVQFELTDEEWQELTKLDSYNCYAKNSMRAKPGEDLTDSPFSPDAPQSRRPRHELSKGYSKAESPFSVTCLFQSKGWVLVQNTTGSTIPAGTVFAISYPVDQVLHLETHSAIPPGYGLGMGVPSATYGLPCDAWVWKMPDAPEIVENKIP